MLGKLQAYSYTQISTYGDNMTKTFTEKFIAAQMAMGAAKLDKKNPHFKSTYASLASVIETAVPALNAQGLAYVGEIVDGCAVTRITDGKDEMTCAVPIMVADKCTAQQFGSALTYSKRQGLLMLCGMATADDDDANSASEAPADKKPDPLERATARLKGIDTMEALEKAQTWVSQQTASGMPLERFKLPLVLALNEATDRLHDKATQEQ